MDATDESSHKFIDLISLGLIKDPAIAADGLSYDRQTITKWLATQPIRGRQSTSVQN